MDRSIGFSLLELLTTLLVAGTLLTRATPGLRAVVLDNRRTADINAFVLGVQLARSEAAKRGRPVVLCKSQDLVRCGGADVEYEAGWIVFVNIDDRRPPQRAPAEPLLYAHAPATVGTIRGNRAYFEFRPGLRRSVNGTVTFCDARGPAAARAVIVSYTGRPRVDSSAPGGESLRCAVGR